MPFINTTTSTTISRKQEIELKEKLGKAIELIPGKTERGLMLAFSPETKMYLRGDSTEPMVLVEVKLLGEQSKEIIEAFNAELVHIYSDILRISVENIYITYSSVSQWGCNGKLL